MKKILSRSTLVVCTGVLSVAFAGCPGGTGPTDGGDCGEGEVVHPYSGECVADCSADATVCEGETPVCIGAEGDGGTSGGDSLFAGLCGCDDTSCGVGEICHPLAGVCVDACNPFEVEGDGGDVLDCPEVDGEAWACYRYPGLTDYICQPPCAVNDDCVGTGGPVCDDGYCVAYCDSEDPLRLICPDDMPCNVQTGLCGGAVACMDNDDCGALVCNVESGECVGCTDQAECGENQDCDFVSGECFDTCTTIGIDPICTATDDVCVPGDPVNICEDECLDETCITTSEQLCQYDTQSAEYNQCLDPDTVTGWCDNAISHVRDPGGAIIYAVEFLQQDAHANCTGGDLVGRYRAHLYSEAALPGAIYTEGITYLNAAGTPGLTFGSFTEAREVPGMDNYYEVDFTLCESGIIDALAVYVDNVDEESSNAICFLSGVF